MRNEQINAALAPHLAENGIPPLPTSIVDSHGMKMDVSGDRWTFNIVTDDVSYNFANKGITNPWLLYAIKRHVIASLRRVSPRESANILELNVLNLSKGRSWAQLKTTSDLTEHARLLAKAMSEVVELLSTAGTLYNFSRIRAWYSWCADYLPEFGFDADEAYRWEKIRVPGNEKGIAVRTDDPSKGPLDDAELILLRKALQRDSSPHQEHKMQRAAIWISLVYGRNPANIVQLRESDISFGINEPVEDVTLATINIPRIKKRSRPRTQFIEEYVDRALVPILAGLAQPTWRPECGNPADRPLFKRATPRPLLDRTHLKEWAWHLTSTDFTTLIREGVARYGIISPRTGEPLELNSRRLRYTFATNRVKEGISARDLADALDHTDLQNVRVYFDVKSSLVPRLDRAGALEVAPILRLFTGRPVKDRTQATNATDPTKRILVGPELIPEDHHIRDLGSCGKREFCSLHPPYSCYPCDLFEPFMDSLDVHEMVFDFLIERRERLRTDPLESTRIAVQLDEVIYACAEVILAIRSLTTHHGTQ